MSAHAQYETDRTSNMSARANNGRTTPNETACGEANGPREFQPAQQEVRRREIGDQALTSIVRSNGPRMMPARASAGRAVREVEQQAMAPRTSGSRILTNATNDEGSDNNTESVEEAEAALQNAIQQLNATETSDETNLRRANNTSLQNALRRLGSGKFASNADRVVTPAHREGPARPPQPPVRHLNRDL